jgi:hypothetical protein
MSASSLRLSGAEGTRTPCLYSAIVALSQMSYSPVSEFEYTQIGQKCQIIRP